ncbi:hypothetical protein BKA93DRAFT_889522 [Sparassis latifolia]
MPRRPRPATRRPPHSAHTLHTTGKHVSTSNVETPLLQRSNELGRTPNTPDYASSGSQSPSDDESDEYDSDVSAGSAGDEDDAQDLSDVDPNAPRVSQWVDDEDLDNRFQDESEDEESSEEDGETAHLTKSQQSDISSLPFGALRKAQRSLAQAATVEASEEEDSGDDSEPEQGPSHFDFKSKGKEVDKPVHLKYDIPKRRNKHAPMEATSKRPVPRKKLAEGEKLVPRDPRFLPLAGEFSSRNFQSQYSFLSEMHVNETKTLRNNLKRARKMLASSPRDLREEREQEVQRLERAVKRAESMVGKDRREKVEQEALRKVGKEEREKRKEGKGAWYLKDSDKKGLLLRAKYEALAATGGKGAVKKAIEKKEKKVGQKEKKRRPRPARIGRAPELGGGKRPRATEEGQRTGKRRRVE